MGFLMPGAAATLPNSAAEVFEMGSAELDADMIVDADIIAASHSTVPASVKFEPYPAFSMGSSSRTRIAASTAERATSASAFVVVVA